MLREASLAKAATERSRSRGDGRSLLQRLPYRALNLRTALLQKHAARRPSHSRMLSFLPCSSLSLVRVLPPSESLRLLGGRLPIPLRPYLGTPLPCSLELSSGHRTRGP